ncbi:hypothetical protein L798_12574 [Zootermopsis nevadensis]|uniref:Uncharacterized protein n=1 Tax=Zootermopsis nevadensis TaxID=136037 RepID=A0A067R323_ZOONE|nr:hypothetical protein L798_12574 [Zootermopsis nevadensis]
MEALSLSALPPSHSGHLSKRSQHFWVQVPESHPIKIVFTKDNLPHEIISHQQQGLPLRQKPRSRKNTPPPSLQFIKHYLPFPARSFVRRNGLTYRGTMSCDCAGLCP